MGEMRVLLDTSILLASKVPEVPQETAISAASLAELHVGVHLAKDDSSRALRLHRLGIIESRFRPLSIDDSVARAYGDMALVQRRAGRKVRTRVMDLLIATTAKVHGLVLYTLKYRDFSVLADWIDVRDISS